jgi:hypothetical protein
MEINHRLLAPENKSNSFYASWYGFRAFLGEGLNPYGDEMRTRTLQSSEALGIQLSETDSYLQAPLFGIVVYLPFLLIREFGVAYIWWLTLLEVSAVFIAITGVSFIKKNLKSHAAYVLVTIMMMLVSLAFYHDLFSGSPAIFAFLLLFLGVKSLQNGGDELAGVLLSLLTIFPFLGWISMVFILVWTIRQKRPKVIGWFLGSLVLFGFAVALLEPQWLILYLRMWVEYFSAIQVESIYQLLSSVFPATFLLPGFLTGALAVILLLEWALAGKKEFLLFYWTFHLTLLLEALLTVNVDVINLIFVPISLIFLAVLWEDRWNKKGVIVSVIFSAIVLGLPWLLDSLLGERGPIQHLVIVSVTSFLLLIDLYWIRWWLTRNVLLWHSSVYSLDQSDVASTNDS